MNIMAGISDNTRAIVSSETGTRSKEASEQPGEGSQQRFADVLPLAQAAIEPPSEKRPAEKGPAPGRSDDAKVAVDSPVRPDRSARRRGKQGEDAPVDPQIGAWPFAGIVQPVVSRPAHAGPANVRPARATTGQQTTEPVVSGRGPRTIEQTATPTPAPTPLAQKAISAGSPLIRGEQSPKRQQTQQIRPAQEAPAGEQPAGVRAAPGVVTNVATAKGQETALPVEAMGRPAPTMPRMSQEKTTAPVVQVAPTVARGMQAGHADIRSERVRSSPGARVANPAPQIVRQEAPVPAKPTPGGQPGVVGEKPEHTSAKAQPTVAPETPLKSGKAPQGQALSTEGRQDRASKPSAARSESSKAKAIPTDGKDIPSPGPKEAGAMMPELRVSPTGDATTPSQRVAAQTQSQPGVDAPPIRSPVQSVGEQIVDSMHASATRGDRQILVRLNPPELGTVLVRFQEQGDHLTGTLEVSRSETRREIEQALPQVVRALQEAGVQVRRIEIVASDQPERDLGGEHQPQDVWQQHQGTGQGREHSHGSPQARWSQSAGGHSTIRQGTPDDEPQTAAAPGRIDVLL